MKRASTATERDLANLRMLLEVTQFLAYAALVAAETE